MKSAIPTARTEEWDAPNVEPQFESAKRVYKMAKSRTQRAATSKASHVHFDEREDVIASLELLCLLVSNVDKNPSCWKWCIIAAHDALQGALVCKLSGTAEIGALRKDLQSAWLDWLDNRKGPPPETKLASFKTLLKWARSPKRRIHSEDVPLKLSPAQTKDLHKLHDFRNQFAHYAPLGWAIQKAGLPRIILTASETAEHLMLNYFHIRMHLSGNQIRRIEGAARAVRVALG